jgi:acid stress chaperone HdeB
MRCLMGAMLPAVVCVLAFGPARAQVTIDVSKITCDQFLSFSIADPEKIALWISGYYHGTRNNTILDTETLKDNLQKVKSYCIVNGKVPVMQAVDIAVLGGSKK